MVERYFSADRGLNHPDVWYIRDHDVPAGQLPVIVASTTSETYARLIAEALNTTIADRQNQLQSVSGGETS